jgi:glucose-6-phosphate 1-epimerase
LVTLYEYTRQPRYWIVHDEEGYWLVPVRNGGWSERVPFVGHATSLRPVTDTEGIDLGIPKENAG